MGWMAEREAMARAVRRRCGPRRGRWSCWPRPIRRRAIRWRCWRSADRGAVSVYAQGKDYHDLVKRRLKRLGRWLVEAAGGEIKVFVDTAPVMEKPLAQAAGLGWQGKHTNLLGRDLGNWVFLGAIFTTLELEPDAPEVEPLRKLHRLSGHLPDARPFRRPISWMRGAAFPT